MRTMAGFFDKLLFFPSVFLTMVSDKATDRNWYDRIDDCVVLGAIPFRTTVKQVSDVLVRMKVLEDSSWRILFSLKGKPDVRTSRFQEYLACLRIPHLGRNAYNPISPPLEAKNFSRSSQVEEVESGQRCLIRARWRSTLTTGRRAFGSVRKSLSANVFSHEKLQFSADNRDLSRILLQLVIDQRITGILSLNENYELNPMWYPSMVELHALGVDFLQLPVRDYTDFPSWDQAKEGLEFVSNVCARNGSAYIHCKAGKMRSPFLAAVYLMKRYSLTPVQARDFVISHRPQVWLGGGQIIDLLQQYYLKIQEEAAFAQNGTLLSTESLIITPNTTVIPSAA